jgi:hypothetical protein
LIVRGVMVAVLLGEAISAPSALMTSAEKE